jgi:hypothetical protein
LLVGIVNSVMFCATAPPGQPATKARTTTSVRVMRAPLKREERTSSEITRRTVVSMRGFLRSTGRI